MPRLTKKGLMVTSFAINHLELGIKANNILALIIVLIKCNCPWFPVKIACAIACNCSGLNHGKYSTCYRDYRFIGIYSFWALALAHKELALDGVG